MKPLWLWILCALILSTLVVELVHAGPPEKSGGRGLARGGGGAQEESAVGYGEGGDSEPSDGSSNDQNQLGGTEQNGGDGPADWTDQDSLNQINTARSLMWRERVLQFLIEHDRIPRPRGDETGDEEPELPVVAPKKPRKKAPKTDKRNRPDYGALRLSIAEAEMERIRPGYGSTLPRLTAFVNDAAKPQPNETVDVQVTYQELFTLNYIRAQQSNPRRRIYWPEDPVTSDPLWPQASILRDAELARNLEVIRDGVRDGFWNIAKSMSGSGSNPARSVNTARKKASKKNKGRGTTDQSTTATSTNPLRRTGNPLFQMLLDAATVVDACDDANNGSQSLAVQPGTTDQAEASPSPPQTEYAEDIQSPPSRNRGQTPVMPPSGHYSPPASDHEYDPPALNPFSDPEEERRQVRQNQQQAEEDMLRAHERRTQEMWNALKRGSGSQ